MEHATTRNMYLRNHNFVVPTAAAGATFGIDILEYLVLK